MAALDACMQGGGAKQSSSGEAKQAMVMGRRCRGEEARRTWSRGRGPASPEGAGGTWQLGFGSREAQPWQGLTDPDGGGT